MTSIKREFSNISVTENDKLRDSEPSSKRQRLNDSFESDNSTISNANSINSTIDDSALKSYLMEKCENSEKEKDSLKKEKFKLQRELDDMKEENLSVKNKLKRLIQEKNKAINSKKEAVEILQKENSKLEEQKKYLLNIIKNGRQPICDETLLNKYSTERLTDLYFENRKEFSDFKIELDTTLDKKQEKEVEMNIRNYLMENGQNILNIRSHSDPLLSVSKDTNFTKRRSEIFEIYDTNNKHNVQDLFNPSRTYVKVLDKIVKKNSVLGLYDGFKMTVEEFDKFYYGTDLLEEISCYATDAKNDKYEYIIDPKGYFNFIVKNNECFNNRNLIFGSYINDTRRDILKSSRNSIESNISLVKCNVNDWPVLFIVAKKDIKQNNKLYLYYGDELAVTYKNMKIKENSVREKYQIIQQKINQINYN